MYNNDLYSIIKQVAVNAVNSAKPCDWCYGCVKAVEPVVVSLSDQLEIDEDFVEFGCCDKDGLQEGDRLVLLRKAGGQRFLCLGVVR